MVDIVAALYVKSIHHAMKPLGLLVLIPRIWFLTRCPLTYSLTKMTENEKENAQHENRTNTYRTSVFHPYWWWQLNLIKLNKGDSTVWWWLSGRYVSGMSHSNTCTTANEMSLKFVEKIKIAWKLIKSWKVETIIIMKCRRVYGSAISIRQFQARAQIFPKKSAHKQSGEHLNRWCRMKIPVWHTCRCNSPTMQTVIILDGPGASSYKWVLWFV